jgi:glycosyltransferase involved in cell wall biosynthesis
MLNISAIILCKNEEIHLQRCLDSLKSVVSEIFVIDSGSTDRTMVIAKSNGASIYENAWVNYSNQFNWALDNCHISTDWIIRIDADEYLTPELQLEIRIMLPILNDNVSGIEIPLKRVFLGRHMKRGLGQIKMVRIFRKGKSQLESRWMDEHIEITEGRTISFKHSFVDDNLNDIGWWITKHNSYAKREVIDLLDVEFGLFNSQLTTLLSEQALLKRKLKIKYVKLPLFLRSFSYFVYRYFIGLGFVFCNV